MSGKGISQAPSAPAGYCPSQYTERDDGEVRLEEEKKAEEEDRTRARLLRRAASSNPDVIDVEAALAFAYKLEDSILQGEILDSPASSRYMREFRQCIVGWLWLLRDKHPELPQALCTLISHHWENPALDLDRFDPAAFLKRLRVLLYYYGAGDADGYLAGSVHSEFEPEAKVHRIHFHAIAAGGMIDVVDSMRQSPMLRGYTDRLGDMTAKKRAVKIQRDLTNLPDPLTYAFQAFASVRVFGSPGIGEMRGKRRRISEPFHSQYLLWQDRWRLEHLTLLVGLRVTNSGLILT